jgi:precorrin-6B methylase 1
VGVVAIMFVVVLFSGTTMFFPFGGSYQIEMDPEQQAALPGIVAFTILIAAITLVVIIGSWIYSRGRLSSESQ